MITDLPRVPGTRERVGGRGKATHAPGLVFTLARAVGRLTEWLCLDCLVMT